MKNTKSVHPHKLAAAAVILACMLGAGLTGCSTTIKRAARSALPPVKPPRRKPPPLPRLPPPRRPPWSRRKRPSLPTSVTLEQEGGILNKGMTWTLHATVLPRGRCRQDPALDVQRRGRCHHRRQRHYHGAGPGPDDHHRRQHGGRGIHHLQPRRAGGRQVQLLRPDRPHRRQLHRRQAGRHCAAAATASRRPGRRSVEAEAASLPPNSPLQQSPPRTTP